MTPLPVSVRTDSLAEGSEFELPVPVSNCQTTLSGCGAFLSPSNVADSKADPAFEPRAIPTIRPGAANPDVLLSSDCSQIGTGSSNSLPSASESLVFVILFLSRKALEQFEPTIAKATAQRARSRSCQWHV